MTDTASAPTASPVDYDTYGRYAPPLAAFVRRQAAAVGAGDSPWA